MAGTTATNCVHVSYTHWELVVNFLRKEGYEPDPPNDTLPSHETDLWEKLFVQGDKMVWVKVFDPAGMTRERVAAGTMLTALMSIFTAKGFIIPFPN